MGDLRCGMEDGRFFRGGNSWRLAVCSGQFAVGGWRVGKKQFAKSVNTADSKAAVCKILFCQVLYFWNGFNEHGVAGFVVIGAGHLHHVHGPFFYTGVGGLLAKGWITGLALLVDGQRIF
jgi:hypothetical protein